MLHARSLIACWKPSHSQHALMYQYTASVPQVKLLLGKVQAVFDLPRRLHAAIDHGALEIAVATYADAEQLLRRYGHKARA